MRAVGFRGQVAREMLDSAEAELVRLRAEVAHQEIVVAALRRYCGKADDANGRPSVALGGKETEASKLPDMLLQILEKAGGPMRLTDIAEEAERQGAESSAKAGLKSVINAALIRRDDLFRRTGPGTYALVERRE